MESCFMNRSDLTDDFLRKSKKYARIEQIEDKSHETKRQIKDHITP